MLNLLIAEKKVSASELSRRLGVSVRTVYRDAEALCAAGFPLFATPGRDGGFELVEGFRMTGQTFSTGELRRVISALEGLSGICPEGELEALKRKFALLLTESGSRGVPCPEGSIFIELTPSRREKRMSDEISRSIALSTVLRIRYCDAEGRESEREIESQALLFYWQSWFVYAWCRLRKDFRCFRVSRISGSEVTDLRREGPKADLASRPWTRQWEEEPLEELCFVADREARGRIAEYFDGESITENADGSVRVCALFPAGDWVVSWILGLPGAVEILSPVSLRERVRGAARAAAEKNL